MIPKPKLPRKKKCKMCQGLFQPTRSIQPCCNFNCEIAYATEHAKKKAANREFQANKKERAAKREAAKKTKEYRDSNYPKQFDLTKQVVQRWAGGVRDAGKPCISCSTTNDVQYAGGHYRTVGANPELALDTRNIHRQCNKRCNCELGGNIHGAMGTHGYVVGLVNRYGQSFVDWLDGPHEPKKYTCEQLREIRAYYAKLTRQGIKSDEDRPYK
ncbi:MAG: recombination protein NinG [Shewanella sp.]